MGQEASAVGVNDTARHWHIAFFIQKPGAPSNAGARIEEINDSSKASQCPPNPSPDFLVRLRVTNGRLKANCEKNNFETGVAPPSSADAKPVEPSRAGCQCLVQRLSGTEFKLVPEGSEYLLWYSSW